jgi:aminoglycoside phosphotransferase (APT) family kinase protein
METQDPQDRNGETLVPGPETPHPSRLGGALESARVRAWLNGFPGFENSSVDAVDPLTDGLSNVTCRLSLTNSPVASAVLRVQPKAGIFEPYDVVREAAVLRCLSGTSVPVPGVLATESDASFFGAPCLLMEWVDAPHMPAPEVDPAGFATDLSPFAQALVAIHTLDWRAAGLDFLGIPDSPSAGFAQEIDVVQHRMRAFGCDEDPLLVRALSVLHASTPAGGRLALCHGDPNPFNYLFRDGKVVAVVDWEQARISDPRSDVAQLVALSHLRRTVPFGPVRENLFVQLYEGAADETLEGLDLFRAFWVFQLGVVFHGWKTYGIEPWFNWKQIEDLLPLALAELPGGTSVEVPNGDDETSDSS